MRTSRLFWGSLVLLVFLHCWYGVHRLALGIDFTDEGAYLSWPMRMLFGEKPFAAELATLFRPIEAYLFLVFKLHPTMTLYEFRWLGWAMHLLSFCILSIYLFRLSNAPLQSPLIASVPFYLCHIFGLASPSYNTVSSDFLLMALSLRGLSAMDGMRGKIALGVGSGLALFIATVAHPALGLLAAVVLVREWSSQDLVSNFRRLRPGPTQLGAAVFVSCWLAFSLHLLGTGALARWFERIALFRSFDATISSTRPAAVYLRLAAYPFSHSKVSIIVTGATLAALGVMRVCLRYNNPDGAKHTGLLLGCGFIVSLIGSFSHEPAFIPMAFALVSLLLVGTLGLNLTRPAFPMDPEIRFLLLMSGLGAVLYACFTFYFTPFRSWMSGILALPFAFSVGLSLLLQPRPARSKVLRPITGVALALAVACAAREHYRNIYRDADPTELQTTFHIPKLAHIKSTEERVRAVEGLYAYLHPKLTRGETLLAYDSCPLLYYLFDTPPAYGLTWAATYTLSPAALVRLNQELRAGPLPRYAIRTRVDLSNPVWNSAPPAVYDHYPLNETVTASYELERTIFPFEVWRLKDASP